MNQIKENGQRPSKTEDYGGPRRTTGTGLRGQTNNRRTTGTRGQTNNRGPAFQNHHFVLLESYPAVHQAKPDGFTPSTRRHSPITAQELPQSANQDNTALSGPWPNRRNRLVPPRYRHAGAASVITLLRKSRAVKSPPHCAPRIARAPSRRFWLK